MLVILTLSVDRIGVSPVSRSDNVKITAAVWADGDPAGYSIQLIIGRSLAPVSSSLEVRPSSASLV